MTPRSFVIWTVFGVIVANMVPWVGAYWGCGWVDHYGTIWKPEGGSDCGGQNALTNGNKCYLRKGVNVWQCLDDTSYDYYWVNRWTKMAEKFPNKNCFGWHGADPTYGHGAPKILNLEACQKECLADQQCDGVVVESPPSWGTDKQEAEIERCWLRKGIHLGNCHRSNNYDIYFHSKTDPNNFNQHSPGTNCYGGAGADNNYGQSTLKHEDGTEVKLLGDCKAACHTDNSCEGILVQLKNGWRSKLFEVSSDHQRLTSALPHASPAHAILLGCAGFGLFAAMVTFARFRGGWASYHDVIPRASQPLESVVNE